jgi:glutamate racemase
VQFQNLSVKKIILVESGLACAKELDLLLGEHQLRSKLESKQSISYYVTDDVDGFNKMATKFLKGSNIQAKLVF